MIHAISRELTLRKNYLNEPLETIYFGGGTPSLLKIDELNLLFKTIYDNFDVSETPEITLEANPDDLSNEYIRQLLQTGVNRLSIGIQSFDENQLSYLHRSHSAQQAIKSFMVARDAGFKNISIDLIFALPSKDHSKWDKDLSTALGLKPEHISCYNLTIEPRTVFGNWYKKQKIDVAEEDYSYEQYRMLIERLTEEGYDHYEISNFCLPGMYSRHNTSYWQMKKYLGIGPGAHSFDGKTRQFNIQHNPKYLKSIHDGLIPCDSEHLTPKELVNDYLLTSLRTKWGCDLGILKDKYGYDLKTNPSLEKLTEKNLVSVENNKVVLTLQGRFLADRIIEEFILI